MKKVIYGVYGASGFGKEVMPLIRAQLELSKEYKDNLFFIDDSVKDGDNQTLNNYQILNFKSFLELHSDEYYVNIAIGNSNIREELTLKCLEKNIKLFDIKAGNVVILDEVSIGKGSTLCSFVTLTSNINIGKSFQANIYSYVGHDCVIGDYVTFAPAVKCNGNVIIEDYAYIGTGAIIKQGKPNKPLRIGKGAVVSAGAFVTKNVPENTTVFGNPAVKFTKENMKRLSSNA